ncbi:MAG: MATE family efflux transporter [Rhodospirillaceae bacterium]|nr:MATE family efflux transporter [Rhodospirillaceae bacterium]
MSDEIPDVLPTSAGGTAPSKGHGHPRGHNGGMGGGKGGGGARLTEGLVSKQILNLTRYLLMGTLATMSFQLADAYFVAQLGTSALAALAFTFPMVMILHAIALGLGTGVTSVVSRAVGNGELDKARVLTSDAIILAFIVALIFAIGGLLLVEPLYDAMGAEPHVLENIKSYMHVWFVGMPVMIVPLIANSVIRAFGDAKFPSLIMGGTAILNIFLDPILIFGFGPIPGYGLQGAAIALLISRFVTFALSLYVLQARVHGVSYKVPSFGRLLHSWNQLLHIALPSTATQLIQPVSAGILTTLIASYGATAVAAYGIATRIEMFALIFVMSLSIAIAPFVGQNAGAGRLDRVRDAIKFAYKASLAYGVVVAGILAMAGGFIAHEFSDDGAVIALAAFYLLVVPVSYGCMGIINISSGSLNAMARPMPAMVIGAAKSMVIQIPCAYAGSILYGIKGVFMGIAASTLTVAIIAFILARRTVRSELQRADASAIPQTATSAAE